MERDFIQNEKEATQQAEEIKDLFDGLTGPGYTALLWRVAPNWCDGFLEEIEIDPGQGFDIGYICQKWGGQKIMVKLKNDHSKWVRGKTINLKSWAPKHFGKILDRADHEFGEQNRNFVAMPNRYKEKFRPMAPPAAPQIDPNKLIENVLGMAMEFQKNLSKTSARPSSTFEGAASAPAGDPFGQLMAAMKTFKEMQKFFGQADVRPAAAAPDEDSALFSTIGQVIQLMTNRQEQQNQARPLPPAQNPALYAKPANVQNDTARAPMPKMDLPGLIAQMPPDQIGDIIVSAASRMNPQQRENAFQTVATRLAGLTDVEYDDDGSLNGDDFEDDESLTDDEFDESDESDEPSNTDPQTGGGTV